MGRAKRKHDEDNSEAVAGDRVVALRLVNDTTTQYAYIIERFKRWLPSEHPEFVVNSVIQLPLSTKVCQTYLDFASVKRDATGKELVAKCFNSFSTIGTCKSAIKYLYKEANIQMHDELEARLKDFANGYKRHIAQLREDGEMPIGEGKLPMTVDGIYILHE
ncbi:hypothetical protein H257_06685 [Aphanomyces astaci]|uniref:Uncharacterized protein n=1 Tax=Aphanomyces astaci TaxID=112090 RepID=W4GLY0_APHAT|nr:hypothetical protein H257_06685 [Aphanomyces astaci]ETV80376.1 hypothetical protein H257_06685 [Aphanomyces astaci]|eukprot:XP_009830300.1 hypothetical protein H257_06685 [Aphanomyces astaci]